jgi:hypothetical protein
MFETLALAVLCLVLLFALVLLPVLVVIKTLQSLFQRLTRELLRDIAESREQIWRNADAPRRERIVRRECAWRTIGRVVGASALVAGGFTTSPVLAVIWVVAAWRALKPITQEMQDASSYRSTGTEDEKPYSW